jgi:hypothetical protein
MVPAAWYRYLVPVYVYIPGTTHSEEHSQNDPLKDD